MKNKTNFRQNKLNYKIILVCLSIISIFLISEAALADSTLTETYTTPEGNFVIHYTSDSTGEPVNAVTSLQVQSLGQRLQQIRTKALSYGFNDPGSVKPVDILEQGINAHGGCGGMNFDPYWLDGGVYPAPSTPNEKVYVPFHEYMHVIQFCYAHSLATGGGQWITEGQARMSQDKYSSATDAENGSSLYSYIGQVMGYLRNPDRSLFDLSYDASLFWGYLADKYGTITTEPDRGFDVLVQFWESLESFGGSHPTIEMVFADMFTKLGYPGTTLQDVYKDFIVANYAKDVTSAPAKYKYVDETQAPGSYGPVTLNRDESLTNNSFKAGTESVSAYQPKYYQFNPASDVRRITIDTTQYSGQTLFYDVITIDQTDTFTERRFETQNLSVTLTGQYKKVLLIISGLETQSTPFNYYISTGGQIKEYLQILTPTNSDLANVGYFREPEKFIAIVVVNNGSNSIKGLSAEVFQASTTKSSVRILSVVYINGLYFLELQPTAALYTAGWADLTISIPSGTGLSDTKANSVLYEESRYSKRFNTIIVLDTSLSMNNIEKIDAAKAAARLYTNSETDGNYLGLVEFSTNGNVVVSMDNVTDNRNLMITGINSLVANGFSTSVGDGIFSALQELVTVINATGSGIGTNYKKIIVLTDGQENNAKYISDVFWQVVNNQTHFYSVILGTDAEGSALQSLSETAIKGGAFYAFEPASGTLANDLADTYRTIFNDDTNRYTIYKYKDVINTTNWQLNHQFPLNVAMSGETSVVLNYRATNEPSNPQLILPNGTILVPDITDHSTGGIGHYGHFIWKLPAVLNGLYNITLKPSTDYFEYYIEASTTGPYTANIYFGATGTQRVVGNPMPIMVSLSDNVSSLKNAVVEATILSGTNYEDIFTWNINLYDDGMHNDLYPNDGVYGTVFYPTVYTGGYIVDIKATGTDNAGNPYTIYNSESFIMDQASDKDQDSMPDNWELRNGLNPNDNSDAAGDNDNDGLLNLYEYLAGSSPLLADTDYGGEGDYAEVFNGHNPRDAKDDVLHSPYLTGIPQNGKNTIFFAFNGSYSVFGLYRATAMSGPYTLISGSITPTQDNYTDMGLVNGNTYYYKMLGKTASNRLTGYSNILVLKPNVDTMKPSGIVIINNNEKHTDNRDITIKFFSLSPDIVTIELADNPKFIGKVTHSVTNTISWNLGSANGLKMVYYRFIDTTGNVGGFPNGDYGFVGVFLHDPTPYTAPSTTTSSTSSSAPGIPSFTIPAIFMAVPILVLWKKRMTK